jgi:hypothetical protein
MIPVAGATVAAAAAQLDFGSDQTAELDRATTVLCEYLMVADFDTTERAAFELTLEEDPAGLTVRIEDRGLPFSLHTATDLLAGIGFDHCDLQSVRVDHADPGNRVSLRVSLPSSPGAEIADHGSSTDPVGQDVEISVRPLQVDDLESLARCTWRVYGYSYVADYLYHPDRVRRLIDDGWLHSHVAVTDDGEVVGQLAIVLEHPDDRVGDSTLAMVDPRFRHHHILPAMSTSIHPVAGQLGLVGLFHEAVTTHTITQRGVVDAGGVETGILLGFIPSTMCYRGIAENLEGRRQSAVLGYTRSATAPRRTVVLPERYADEISRIFGELDLDRELTDPGSTGQPVAHSQLTVAVEVPRSLATISVRAAGGDLADAVEHHRRLLTAQGVDIVHVELGLSDPHAAAAVEGLRERGFFYAGMIPEIRDGDILRLQYLDVVIDTDIIELYSETAKRLLEFTLADRG